MTNQKKPTRQYDSTRRQEQARQTRRLVLEAARILFGERGYAGATIEAIAEQAEVAPETVYAIYGSKRGLLTHLIDITVGGDEQPIQLLDRPGPSQVLQEEDPERQIELFTLDITQILERIAPLFPILRTAAKTEPEIADLLRGLLETRRQNLARFVQSLSVHGPLRAGLDLEQATDLVWTLSSPEVFNLLTLDRGQSSDSFARWLSDALTRLLLP
jgi:TetR/AcrR family transcriptional regulator of autoinduction and epiphytic fitness